MLPGSVSCAMWFVTASFFLPIPQDPPAQPAKPTAPPVDEKQDPFAVDSELEKLLDSRKDGFEPLDDRPALPRMKLKGYIEMEKGDSPAAAVEIDGIGTYIARKDGKIAFSISGRFQVPSTTSPTSKSGGATRTPTTAQATRVVVRDSFPIILLVKDITPEGVLVEIGTLGETMVIR